MKNSRKVRIKSSPCGPDELGYTRATMKLTKSYNNKLISKKFRCSNYKLKLACMKMESLVIANQNVAVNLYLGLVHTARHMQRVIFTLRFNLQF